MTSRQGFGELKTEQLGGHSQEQQRHRQAPIDDDKDEWVSWPSWLVTYRNGLPVHRRSPMLVLTESDVAQLR